MGTRAKRLMVEPEKGFYLLRVFKDRNNQNKRAEQWAAITQDRGSAHRNQLILELGGSDLNTAPAPENF